MTSRNTPLSSDGAYPFLLSPAAKDYIWGGDRLNDEYAKDIPLSPLAETWECSTHPDGVSEVASGEFAGMSLAEVLRARPEYIGSHPKPVDGLPILIKFIDAKQDLSIQVHPDDEFAWKYEHGQRGKTEMWYVLDAAKDASIILGLHHSTDVDTLRRSIQEGTIGEYLQRIRVKENDLFYVEAGTIHAIGAGTLLVEIQESSNLTYRLYDYDRVGKDGKKRELHVEKALAVARLEGNAAPSQPMRILRYRQGCATELLCRCKYFEVHRMIVNTERCRELIDYHADSTSFRILLCMRGCGSLYFADETIIFFKGDCIFVPADSIRIKIHGNAEFLDVRG